MSAGLWVAGALALPLLIGGIAALAYIAAALNERLRFARRQLDAHERLVRGLAHTLPAVPEFGEILDVLRVTEIGVTERDERAAFEAWQTLRSQHCGSGAARRAEAGR